VPGAESNTLWLWWSGPTDTARSGQNIETEQTMPWTAQKDGAPGPRRGCRNHRHYRARILLRSH
jgi:hypothetical protein